MSAAGERVQLFLGEHERAQADVSLPHGEVCVRSIRSPDKQTDNEDSAAVIQLGDDSLVLAVADGVGGSVAGREASNATMRALSRVLTKLPDETPQLRPAILDAVEEANKAVLGLARGAATTLVVAQLDSTRLRSYHVGDSELLAVGQRGRIKQRVVPHSPTGFAVEAGLLDENDAVQHDQRHILFNVIGSTEMRVEVGPALQLAVRDTVLLASDGLFDNLYIDEIVDTIRRGPLVAAADRLVARVRARMQGADAADQPCKPDELTIVLFRPHKVRVKSA
jgi:protein phosphatase